MALIGKDISIWTKTVSRIGRDSSVYTTNQRIGKDLPVYIATKLRVGKDASILTKTTTAAYETEITERYRTVGLALIVKNLSTGETKTIPRTEIVEITLSKRKNEPFSWTATLDNGSRNYSPYNASSAYYGWLTPDTWNASGVINRVWQIKINTGGRLWESPYLTLDDFSHNGSIGGQQVSLSGIDLTEYLMRENQTMASWISLPGNIKMAKTIAGQILTNFKVTNYNISFTDYPVWKLHFQGERPLDVLNRLFAVPRCVWYWDKDTFFIKDPAWKPNGPADWTYASGNNLILLDYKRSKRALVNQVEARRTLDAVYTGADQEGNDVGAKEITFSTPLWNATMQRETRYCYIDYVYWHNAKGETGTSPGPLEPVTKVTFIVWPWASVPYGSQYYWRVIIRGMENYSDTVLGTNLFDRQYHVRIKNQTSIDKYGLRPEREPYEDPMIPNREWARRYCERKLDESGRLLETMTFECPLNPFMEPNDTARITENHAGIDGYFLIENVDISIGSDIMQTFGCTKYLA